ncbi:rCG44150, isoform CRA_c [Rattus norvegicus]|uniref:RCG44150, isoform CRA_c n=1 Tax=Rattus norvegicus TaxID=10116 RepID=A6J7P4_RAT|nr:rCG44150, isoform CRA_c [Rattus norvegicus]
MAHSSQLPLMLRNCHQCHYIGLLSYASGNHMWLASVCNSLAMVAGSSWTCF